MVVLSQAEVAHAFNANTWEAELGQSWWVWGQPGLQNEFQDNQRYTEKPCRGLDGSQAIHAGYGSCLFVYFLHLAT